MEEGGRRGSRSQRFEDAMMMALKVEEEITSQGMQGASRKWRSQGNRFSLGFLE